MLLLVNVLVLLTFVTQANAQFLFFADWTDLGGALGGSPTATRLSRGTTASHAANGKAAGAAAKAGAVLPPLPPMSPSGVISYTVKGPRSGLTGRIVVQLPRGYTDHRNTNVRYPVIEAFQGYPGSSRQWIDTMNLGGEVAKPATAKRMGPALVVSPQTEIPAGVDTECVNGAGGSPPAGDVAGSGCSELGGAHVPRPD